MAKEQISIKMDSITKEPSHISFKSAAMIAAATTKRTSNSNLRSMWIKKRSSSKQLSLELYTFEGSVPVIALAAEGRLDELKVAIEVHDLTFSEVDKNGHTLLHIATLHNQQQVMSFLIDCGISLDAVNSSGNTALHLAAESDLPEACSLLLENGASDSILNIEAYAPIHLAACGKNNALRAILDHPVDYSIVGHRGKTPLHIICEYDNIEGLNILKQKITTMSCAVQRNSIRFCSTDNSGLTPIHLAARRNSHQVLDSIIRSCTQHNYTTEQVLGFLDEENSTPLHAAIDSCNTEVAEVLLKHGASPTVSKGDLIPPLHLACSQGRTHMVKMMVEHAGPEIVSSKDQQQKTPLHHCAVSIHSSCMISFLVERGKGIIEIDARDVKGRTPLHNAVTSANLAGTKELLSQGADPLLKDNKGLNSLHLALCCGRKVIVNALLELPCAPELIGNSCHKGNSGIHHALRVGNGEVIPKMIAALRFEVQKMEDKEGNTYLHLATEKGNIKALRALLDVPDIHKLLNQPNNAGMTPLHSAAMMGHYRCIDTLLNNGAMFHRALNGETAFMIACKKGFTSSAKLLLQAHPCQISMIDNEGNTALHAAAQSKTPSMITLLLDKQCKLSINSESLSFFDLTIDSADLDCVMAVINHDRWQECLDFCSPSRPSPIISLIEQMPKAAKAVFDRCHKKANLDKSHPDYWESYDFKYLYSLKSHEGLAFAVNPSTETEQDASNNVETTVKYKGDVQNSTTSSPDQDAVRQFKKRVCYGQETMKILQRMKHFKRQALLTHPVVNAFLDSKWRRYGSFYYFTWYSFQALLTMLLSVFVVIVPNPVRVLNETSFHSNDEMLELSSAANVIRALALVVCVALIIFMAFNWVIYFRRHGSVYLFLQVTIWVQFLAFALTFIFFLFPNPLHVWPLGAFSCFFSWCSLLFILEYISIAGTIVKMLLEVTKTVFLVLCISVFLIFAFAFAFYILAGTLSEFDNVGYAFLSVFGFMLGELPYDMYVELNVNRSLPFGDLVLGFILFLAILLSIVLANLLIGLAVGDIERVKLNAIVQRKAVAIEFFSHLDASIPNGTLKRLSLPSYKVYPNKNRWLRRKWRDSWKWIENQIEPEQTEITSTYSTASVIQCVSEITELKLHVLELKEAIHQMQEAQTDFRRHYRGLSTANSMISFDFDPSEEPNTEP